MPTITFAVPCYNSALYMDTCISSLLRCGTDIEIIIVDDGSKLDETPQKADAWAAAYPGIITVIHKENGGHGSAVNAGLAAAHGLYYKVVDSDDWLDETAMHLVMTYLRQQTRMPEPTDLVMANYVYERVFNGTRKVMRLRHEFPVGRPFGWDKLRLLIPGQYLHMHSSIFRTQLLRDAQLVLPEHCFYVDNLLVYMPLPLVKTMFYINADMYRYFIGRADQSVNEDVMLSRIDQHLTVTRRMIDCSAVWNTPETHNLFRFMSNHLSMMVCTASVFLRLADTPEATQKLADLWDYLHEHNPQMFARVKRCVLVVGTNIPGRAGRALGIWGYHVAQRMYGFN